MFVFHVLSITNYLFISFIAGFTTDGEFNSLRTKGKLRPISVIELIKVARQEARSTRQETIHQYFKLNKQGSYCIYFETLWQ